MHNNNLLDQWEPPPPEKHELSEDFSRPANAGKIEVDNPDVLDPQDAAKIEILAASREHLVRVFNRMSVEVSELLRNVEKGNEGMYAILREFDERLANLFDETESRLSAEVKEQISCIALKCEERTRKLSVSEEMD